MIETFYQKFIKPNRKKHYVPPFLRSMSGEDDDDEEQKLPFTVVVYKRPRYR